MTPACTLSFKSYDPICELSLIFYDQKSRKEGKKKDLCRREGSLKQAGNCRIIYFPLLKITRHASFKLGNNVDV